MEKYIDVDKHSEDIKTEIYRYMNIYDDMLPTSSRFLEYIRKYPKTTFFEVTGKYKNRLDLISKEIYGTYHLWWFLGLFNDIIDPDNFGSKIYYIPRNILFDIFEEFSKYGGNKISEENLNKMF